MVDFTYEMEVWNKGFNVVAGVDEVGRGCLAGPINAGCVVFPAQIKNLKFKIKNSGVIINDSKKLTTKQRESADRWIRENALAYGIGEASVNQINKFGIKKATEIAFRKAILGCGLTIEYLLIDAFYIPNVRGLGQKSQKPIIKGDGKSFSIAAASIVAKVYRDKLMERIPNIYGWEVNKGYGTQKHIQAIRKYGVTKLHRKQFVKNYVSSQAL